jgi:hypothetical protein
MAGIRSVLGHRGKNGHCHFPDPDLVYLYFIFDDGITADHLLYPCILDEHQTIYFFCPQEPREISLAVLQCLGVFSYLTEEVSVSYSVGVCDPILLV